MKKKICVLTGSRAEYGHLVWLMRALKSDKKFRLQVVATGAHFSKRFGLTYRDIEKDGFFIDAKVDMKLTADTAEALTRSVSRELSGLAGSWKRLKPDLLVVSGDRYEILAACLSATLAKIPIAHLHGGEITEGSMDDAMRHAITKLSHLHFTSTRDHAKRVRSLGESPSRIFNVGAPGLENARRLKLLKRSALERRLRFSFKRPSFLVTFHPSTLGPADSKKAFNELLKALDRFPHASILFTFANADSGGLAINKMIRSYVRRHASRAAAHASLGSLVYFSAMNEADVVVGNSSSGVIEAPFFKTPSVNIGDRQTGRPRALSVLDARENAADITNAIRKALSPAFLKKAGKTGSLFGTGNTSQRIIEVLKRTRLEGLTRKKFYEV